MTVLRAGVMSTLLLAAPSGVRTMHLQNHEEVTKHQIQDIFSRPSLSSEGLLMKRGVRELVKHCCNQKLSQSALHPMVKTQRQSAMGGCKYQKTEIRELLLPDYDVISAKVHGEGCGRWVTLTFKPKPEEKELI